MPANKKYYEKIHFLITIKNIFLKANHKCKYIYNLNYSLIWFFNHFFFRLKKKIYFRTKKNFFATQSETIHEKNEKTKHEKS